MSIKVIFEAELVGEPYQFAEVRLVEKDGLVYYGFDSGCSCPIPWEDYRSINDYTLFNWRAFCDELYGSRKQDVIEMCMEMNLHNFRNGRGKLKESGRMSDDMWW